MPNNPKDWNKSIKSSIIKAKLVKKTGVPKDAINILQEIQENPKFVRQNIDVQLRIVKYMKFYYGDGDISKKFEAIINNYR